MSDDVSLSIHLLRCAVVVALSVDEVTRLNVVDRHLDRERLICGDRIVVLGEDELRGRHVRRCSNDTHWSRVARAGLDLLAVRDGLVDGQAEVDEVVRGCERGNLAVHGSFLAILRETASNDGRVESWRRFVRPILQVAFSRYLLVADWSSSTADVPVTTVTALVLADAEGETMIVLVTAEGATSEVAGAPNALDTVSVSRTSPTFSEVERIML